MRCIIDFDGTITKVVEKNVEESEPNYDVIKKINKLHDNGVEIVVYTSRGMLSQGSEEKARKKFRPIIQIFLSQWGVKFDELIFGKHPGDLYVDDLGMNVIDFTKPNVYLAKFGKRYSVDVDSMKGIGNYEILGLLKVLNQFCNVFLGGEFSGDISSYNNVYTYKDKYEEMIDYCIIDNGLVEGQKILEKYDDVSEGLAISAKIIRQLIEIEKPILYSLTDPRLSLPDKIKKIFKQDVYILHQNSNTEIEQNIFRGHQEKLCLLTLPVEQRFKSESVKKTCIVCRDDKDRNVIYEQEIFKHNKENPTDLIHVYGNKEFEDTLYFGIVSNNKIHEVYNKYHKCICVPIKPGWLTQKAIECIHFNCIPKLVDYDSKKLVFDEKIKTIEDLLYYKNKLLEWYRVDTWVEYYKKIFSEVENEINK